MSRCLANERQGRAVFYGGMVAEGLIGLVWATVGMTFYQSPELLNAALKAGGPGNVVTESSLALMGSFGGVLAILGAAKARKSGEAQQGSFSLKKVFPTFILFFVLASVITTAATAAGVEPGFFAPFKELSKFLIIMAMGAIGLNTDLVKLVKSGGKPILMGFCCWVAIAAVSLSMQHVLGIW